MTPVIAGSINRTPTGPHRRCDMFIRTQDDSGSITLEVMARGFEQQPVKGRPLPYIPETLTKENSPVYKVLVDKYTDWMRSVY